MDDGQRILTDKNDYLTITIFDCLNRLKYLEDFKLLLINYRDDEIPPNEFEHFRSKLHQKITLIEEYIATSYTPVQIGYKFPGTTNHIQVAMYREIFNPRFDSHIIQAAIDHLDIAIGGYKGVRWTSIINTISPFYWIKRFSFWLSSSFADIFDIELTSRKFYKLNFIVQIITILAALATIYSALVTYFGKPTLWF